MEKETHGAGIENEGETPREKPTIETSGIGAEKEPFGLGRALEYEKNTLNTSGRGRDAGDIIGALKLTSLLVASMGEIEKNAGTKRQGADSQI